MKVLFITTCYPNEDFPQYCVFLEQQAQALISRGINTDVLVLSEDGSDDYETEIFSGVKVIRLSISKPTKRDVLLPTSLPKEDAAIIDKIISKGYDAVSFHFGGLKILRTIIKITQKRNVGLVCHFHGLNVWHEFIENRKWLYNWGRVQKKKLYKKADAIVGVSGKVVDRYRERIVDVPAYTVYNGVNLELFKYSDRSFMEDGIMKILIVANLIELKGHRYLIKAIKLAKEKGLRVKLTIAGRGPMENELIDMVKRLGMSGDVEFTGYIEYEKIADLMRENDIFIMPSYYEALGCVYLEAMSSGMVTVGVHGQGIDEIIKDGENGFLIEPKSANSVLKAIEKISKMSSIELEKMSKQANLTAQEYNWDKSAETLSLVYEKVGGEK